MQEHTITLEGPAASAERIPFKVLSGLLPVVTHTCQRVIRFQAEGRSHIQSLPDWLVKATDLDLLVTEHARSRGNATRLHVVSPTFKDAAPRMFEQLSLFENSLRPEDSAFDVFERALHDAVSGNADSARIDTNILNSTAKFSDVLDAGIESIRFNGGPGPSVHVTRESLETVQRLQLASPPSKKIVISGLLDQLTGSRRSFTLISHGKTIRGYFPTEDNDKYKDLWRHFVLVDAEAVFKPSGDLAFLLATHIAPAQEHDRMWEVVPRPAPRSIDEVKPQKPSFAGTNGLARVFGKWPGDESDEEVMETLKAIG